MKILVLGSGSREEAIIKKLKGHTLYALPGSSSISEVATCFNGSVTDINRIKEVILENDIEFCVVTPDDPLAAGVVDALEEINIPCFGPNKEAAQLESSKSFSKNFMKKYNIPTAEYHISNNLDDALNYAENSAYPLVVKADGLALGKGVVIAKTKEEATSAIKDMMVNEKFKESGKTIVFEEFLEGPEITLLTFCDGKTIVALPSSMDHKRINDNDEGPNTGGMGVITPNPYFTKEIEEETYNTIINPTLEGLKKENITFKGCLYFGLMATDNGVKVIEYNARFGDPETQAILPLLESDLFTIFKSCQEGNLTKDLVKINEGSSCLIVASSAGYPGDYIKGDKITVKESFDGILYLAGAVKKEDGFYYTSGGRVLNVVAQGKTLKEAIDKAYKEIEKVSFNKMHYRKDIGKKGLEKW